jgi:hypothetical protein
MGNMEDGMDGVMDMSISMFQARKTTHGLANF